MDAITIFLWLVIILGSGLIGTAIYFIVRYLRP